MPQHHLSHEIIAQGLNPAVATSQLLKQCLKGRWSCSKEKCTFNGNGGEGDLEKGELLEGSKEIIKVGCSFHYFWCKAMGQN